MIVVKPRAIVNNQIALQFHKRNFALAVALHMHLFIGVIQQILDLKPPVIPAGVFQLIIPQRNKIASLIAPNQLHRFLDDVDFINAVNRNAVFRFQAK